MINVLITGANRGLGLGFVKKYLEKNANVLCTTRDISGAKELLECKDRYPNNIEIFELDLLKENGAETLANQLNGTPIDILINNAGIAHVGNIEACEEKDLDHLYEVNIKGVYNCTRAIIPFMVKNKNGCIINLTSIASSVGIKDRFAYSMSKGAVLTMTYSIASDYINDNIRCNCISPARVHTPFVDGFIRKNYPGQEKQMFENLSKTQPIGRMGTPQEIADLALYLSSDEASFITGSNFPIDGGFVKLNTN